MFWFKNETLMGRRRNYIKLWSVMWNDGKSKGRSYAAVTKSDSDVKSGKSDQRKIWKKKKSSDNVKPENNAKSDNENQGEWIIVERKKKKGKSDKNGVVKVMKSRHGNYCVSMVIKKKKKENWPFIQNWGQWGGCLYIGMLNLYYIDLVLDSTEISVFTGIYIYIYL